MTDVNAHPNGELPELIEQQRRDTVDWQRNNNLSPQGESPVVGEVHISDINQEISEAGSEVTLSSPGQRIVGKVVAASDDELWVDWEDGEQSIEKKANYTLIVAADTPFDPNPNRGQNKLCSCGDPNCPGCSTVV